MNSGKKEIIIIKKLYYDEYEKMYGDGFYPQLSPFKEICTCKNSLISFKLMDYNIFNRELVWTQIDNSVIYGFDGNNGFNLLHSLNKEANVDATRILNCGGRTIYPVIPYLSTYRAIINNIKY